MSSYKNHINRTPARFFDVSQRKTVLRSHVGCDDIVTIFSDKMTAILDNPHGKKWSEHNYLKYNNCLLLSRFFQTFSDLEKFYEEHDNHMRDILEHGETENLRIMIGICKTQKDFTMLCTNSDVLYFIKYARSHNLEKLITYYSLHSLSDFLSITSFPYFEHLKKLSRNSEAENFLEDIESLKDTDNHTVMSDKKCIKFDPALKVFTCDSSEHRYHNILSGVPERAFPYQIIRYGTIIIGIHKLEFEEARNFLALRNVVGKDGILYLKTGMLYAVSRTPGGDITREYLSVNPIRMIRINNLGGLIQKFLKRHDV